MASPHCIVSQFKSDIKYCTVLTLIDNYLMCIMCSWLHNDLKVAMIGPKLDLKYDYEVYYSSLIIRSTILLNVILVTW